MAHPLSVKKRHRQSLRRQERNHARRSTARSAIRKARDLVEGGAQEEARTAIDVAASALDRAALRHAIHPNNAARRKSRLMRQLHTAQSSGGEAPTPKRRTTKARTSSSRTTRSKAKKS